MSNRIKNQSIKTSILVSFIIFSILSMGIIGSISYFFINRVGNQTTTESTDALKEQIQRNIDVTATENADIIREKFSNAESMVSLMAKELENLFSDDSTYGYRETYYDYFFDQTNQVPGLFPDDTVYDASYGVDLSWSYASYYFTDSTPANYLAQTAQLNDTLNTVANMDYVFQMIHDNAPEFRWLYISVPLTGTTLFINYPGSIVGGTITDRINDPYNPVDEEWFQDVRAGDGDIVFTEPYYDEIDGVPLITIGRRVNIDGGYAIICGDISIENIVNKILDVTILETGYASLITSSGLVIAHKDSIPDAGSLEFESIAEVEVNSNNSQALSTSQISQITSGTSGLITFTKDGEEYYLAYRPVGKGDYISLIIVPVAEAIEAVEPLVERMTAAQQSTLWNVLIIVAIAGVSSIIIGLILGNYLVRPIERLKEIVFRLSSTAISSSPLDQLDIQVDEDLINRQDETGDLARGVQNVVDWYKSSFDDKK